MQFRIVKNGEPVTTWFDTWFEAEERLQSNRRKGQGGQSIQDSNFNYVPRALDPGFEEYWAAVQEHEAGVQAAKMTAEEWML